MKNKRLISIKTRIILVNVSFCALAFLGVILIFNVLMDNYLQRTATNQLSRVVTYQSSSAEEASTSTSSAPNLSNAPRGLLNTRPGSFNIDKDFNIKVADNTSELDRQISERIAAALKSKNINLANLQNYRLETGNSTFYIEASEESPNQYTLLYVDISGIVTFSRSVNLFLILVALAMIIILALASAFVTQRMIRPLSQLAAFARQIGRGDFTPNETEFQDLELATLSDTMNAAARQLDHHDQNQKVFFQNASHELRTPLMAIKSYAEGISYDVMEPKEASRVILAETDRMSELVEDLLTLSRLDSLNTQQEIVPTVLQNLMRDVATEQAAIASQKNIRVIEDFAKSAVVMDCNPKALRRAVNNLVSNALRYAKTELVLHCQRENGQIVLAVSNDGPQVSEADLPHLFERFYKGNGGVHGIGLAIVQAVVEQHQGTVQVENQVLGTSFVMRFPMKSK